MTIPRIPAMATAIHPPHPDKPVLPVATAADTGGGEGEAVGDPNSANTVMVSLMFPDLQ